MKEKLLELARQVLELNPTELAKLMPEMKARMQCYDGSYEWEQAVVAFFIINAVRFKSQLPAAAVRLGPGPFAERPRLRVVK